MKMEKSIIGGVFSGVPEKTLCPLPAAGGNGREFAARTVDGDMDRTVAKPPAGCRFGGM